MIYAGLYTGFSISLGFTTARVFSGLSMIQNVAGVVWLLAYSEAHDFVNEMLGMAKSIVQKRMMQTWSAGVYTFQKDCAGTSMHRNVTSILR